MTDLLAGRVVLVSGCGPGLGRAVAAGVLRRGGRAVLSDRLERVHDIGRELDPAGERTLATVVDVADAPDRERLVADVEARFGRLDAVVHVAAVDVSSGGLVDGRLDDWDEVAAVNVRGTLLLTAAAVPLLERSGEGSVVFVGAGASRHPDARFPMLTYAMSKGALVTAAWHLSKELGARGIRVNTVTPVYKWGPALEAALRERAASTGVTLDEVTAPILADIALGRFATDDDVADAIVFFCSPMSRSITGQTLTVDGGQLLS